MLSVGKTKGFKRSFDKVDLDPMAKQICKGKLSRCLNEKEIEWKIPQFISLSEKTEIIFESPVFYFMSSEYQLVIRHDNDYDEYYVDDDSDDGDDDAFYMLFLRRNDKNSSPLKIEVTFTFMWKRIESSIDTHYKLEKSIDWDLENFLLKLYKFKRLNLLEQPSAGEKHWTLIVLCRMKCSELEKESERATPMIFRDFNTLSSDMEKLFFVGADSDVTLRVQGKDYRAHRSILASRSQVLGTVLRKELSESSASVVNIMDCDPDAFEIFLKYLYSGCTDELSVGKAINLMNIAVKYSVLELRSFCVEFLKSHLTAETVCEVATAAEVFGEIELMSVVLSFFNQNNAEIFCTASWENLMKQDYKLACELLRGMISAIPIERNLEIHHNE